MDGTINFSLGVFLFYHSTAVCDLSGTVAGTILAVSTIAPGPWSPSRCAGWAAPRC